MASLIAVLSVCAGTASAQNGRQEAVDAAVERVRADERYSRGAFGPEPELRTSEPPSLDLADDDAASIPDVSGAVQIIGWVLLGVVAAVILFAIVESVRARAPAGRKRIRNATAGTDGARDTSAHARSILADAEAAAARGAYQEAIHILLQVAIAALGRDHARHARPSETARTILGWPEISAAGAVPLGRLVSAVENTRYAGRPASRIDWEAGLQACHEFLGPAGETAA